MKQDFASRSRRGLETAGPGFVVAGLLAIVGHLVPAIVVFGVAFTLGVGAATSPRFSRVLAEAAAAAARWAGRALTRTLLSLVYVFVIVPLGLAARSLGRQFLDRGPSPESSTYWTPHGGPEFVLPARPYLIDPTLRGRRRSGSPMVRVATVVGLVVVVLAADAVLGSGARYLYDRIAGDPRAETAALADAPWADNFFSEFRALEESYVPYVGWQVADTQSQLITSQDGIRRSYEPSPSPGTDPTRIFFFGGSTMWGTGQRDLHTIPSEFARIAESEGLTVEVENFGQSGHVNWQEVERLERELLDGNVPDAVVFYDGYNDVFAGLKSWSFGWPVHTNAELFDRRLTGSPWRRLFDWYVTRSLVVTGLDRSGVIDIGAAPSADQPELGELTIRVRDTYTAGIDRALELARRHDFQVFAYWQPTAHTKDLHELERPSLFDFDGPFHESLEAVLRAMPQELPDDVTDLTHCLDGADTPVMIDSVHTNETGARIVATCMYEDIAPMLEPR